MPHRHDPVTGLPVWLDRAQPLTQVAATLALLHVWQRAGPLNVARDTYAIVGPSYPMVESVRN